jgi:signal transduction histidine kinase
MEVRDTGEGFSSQALGHLFTPFFTTKEGGSGLGLATVRRVIESLGGTVHGRNHPQGGAAVTIMFAGTQPRERQAMVNETRRSA